MTARRASPTWWSAPVRGRRRRLDAAAVNVLDGSAARLTADGDQQFFQGSGGVLGTVRRPTPSAASLA
jgi:hypothetical protein